ncbi:MAG: hypothetical protein IJQ23_01425 [Clostridia bacterium]|nr:hypothetical protein [Clostridia bacterium]
MNSIQLAEKYQPLLDAVYKEAALSTDLESKVVNFDGVDTVKIFKVKVPPLGKYTRNSGFKHGDVDGSWENWKLTQDRGREFSVDSADNEETMDLVFGNAVGEFIRLSVAPQIDAYRFAKLASTAGVSKAEAAELDTGEKVIAALRKASNKLDEDEVPQEGRLLYISIPAKGLIDDLDSYKSKEVMSRFAKVIKVPSSRFYSESEYNAVTEDIQMKAGASFLNFIIVAPSAVQATAKHRKVRIFLADGDDGTGANRNQEMDSDKFQYRIIHDLNTYENKVAGIYVHKRPIANVVSAIAGSYSSNTFTEGGTNYDTVVDKKTIYVTGTVPKGTVDAAFGYGAGQGNFVTFKIKGEATSSPSVLPDGNIVTVANPGVYDTPHTYTKAAFEDDGTLIACIKVQSNNSKPTITVKWRADEEAITYTLDVSGAVLGN